MKMSLRQLFAPALLAVALTPLAFTARQTTMKAVAWTGKR